MSFLCKTLFSFFFFVNNVICGTETRYYTVANPSVNGAGLGTLVDESVYNAADENARGTFTGGYITGGVKVKGAGASFTMNGGAIIANYTDCYGGGISVGDNGSNRLCTLAINGGTIARNRSGRNGGAENYCRQSLEAAANISREKTMGYIDGLPCEQEKKEYMKSLITA